MVDIPPYTEQMNPINKNTHIFFLSIIFKSIPKPIEGSKAPAELSPYITIGGTLANKSATYSPPSIIARKIGTILNNVIKTKLE